MFLFKDQESLDVKVQCKLCLEEISFNISQNEYEKIKKFPIKREYTHGNPAHVLTVFFNKNLEVKNFEINDVKDKEEDSYARELTKQVLAEIDLTDDEIELYFATSGRDAVSLGEIAIISNKTTEESQRVTNKFVEKGLYKKIIGAVPHYTAMPPYAALVNQLKKFKFFISDIKENVPPQLNASFSKIQEKAEGVEKLKEFTVFMKKASEDVTNEFQIHTADFEDVVSNIEKIKNISQDIDSMGESVKGVLDKQISGFRDKFESVHTKISESMNQQIEGLTEDFEAINQRISKGMDFQINELSGHFKTIDEKISDIVRNQIVELTTQIENMKNKISKNLEKLQLGVLQQTVDLVIEQVFIVWLEEMAETLYNQLQDIKKVTNDGLVKTTIGLKRQNKLIEQTNKDGLVKTSIGLKRQLKMVEKLIQDALTDITSQFNLVLSTELKKSIDGTISNIEEITANTTNSGEQIKQIFNVISESFNEVIFAAEAKITGISAEVLHAFDELKSIFSSQVINTLVEVLDKILSRVELSESTTNQFWNQAKKVSLFTMKDIWFIRSEEGAKAQINEEIQKAKAKSLMIVPNLTDINLDIIKSLPGRINVRIAAFIDKSLKEHLEILEVLDQYPNVSYRHRETKDLWGINKDYEEVVICVISESNIDGVKQTEIAGIGSGIQEHIKIFVPIIEDAWLNARKI